MIVKEEGYRYEVQTAEKVPVFDIVFCRNNNGQFEDGITNEELIEVLMHRFTFQVKQKPTEENMNALTHMGQVKQWVHARSYRKLKKRKNANNDSRRADLHVQSESRQTRQ